MVIGVLQLELELAGSQSLKDKRAVLNRIKARVAQKFNVSVADVAPNNTWNSATLGVVVTSNDQAFCNRVLDQIVTLVEAQQDSCLVDYTTEYIHV